MNKTDPPERAAIELENGIMVIPTCDCDSAVLRTRWMTQYVMNKLPAGQPFCEREEYRCSQCDAKMYEPLP